MTGSKYCWICWIGWDRLGLTSAVVRICNFGPFASLMILYPNQSLSLALSCLRTPVNNQKFLKFLGGRLRNLFLITVDRPGSVKLLPHKTELLKLEAPTEKYSGTSRIG